eukprot:5497649-Amphidinium_carterae.1
MCDASCRPYTLLRRRATLAGSSSPSGSRHQTARRTSPYMLATHPRRPVADCAPFGSRVSTPSWKPVHALLPEA